MNEGAFGIRWFWYAVLGIVSATAITLGILTVVDQRALAVAAERDAARYTPPPVGALPSSTTNSAAVTFAVVGDSVTAANSPDIDNGKVGDGSWVYYAANDQAQFAGGWALGGTTTTTMAQNVKHYHADVLVIMAGTNDIGQGVPFSTTTKNLESVVSEAGVKRVVVSAIAPNDATPQLATDYNSQLRALAGQQKWVFVDPMSGVRTSDDRYKAGLSEDGVHPTPAAAKTIGLAIRPIILDTAG